MRTYNLIISSPDGNIFEGEVVNLSLRGANGDLAVMAGHVPFVTSVKSCDCKIEFEDETERIANLDGGILSVSNDKVVLLSGSFKWKDN